MNRRGFLGGLLAVFAKVKLPWPFRRKARVITGTKCVIRVNGQVVGTFENIEFKPYDDLKPAYILGRYEPPMDFSKPITCEVKGWRVIENNLDKLDADPS